MICLGKQTQYVSRTQSDLPRVIPYNDRVVNVSDDFRRINQYCRG